MPPRITPLARSPLHRHLLDLDWDLEGPDPFPPAKSDDEIADLVAQMGAELGVWDSTTRRSRRPAALIRHPRPQPSRPPSPPQRAAKRRDETTPPGKTPPPLPEWARDADLTAVR